MSSISEHKLFGPVRSKAESKADVTNNTARGLIDAEAQRREAKTARLRQARLAQEEKQAAEDAAAPPAPPKTARAKRSAT